MEPERDPARTCGPRRRNLETLGEQERLATDVVAGEVPAAGKVRDLMEVLGARIEAQRPAAARGVPVRIRRRSHAGRCCEVGHRLHPIGPPRPGPGELRRPRRSRRPAWLGIRADRCARAGRHLRSDHPGDAAGGVRGQRGDPGVSPRWTLSVAGTRDTADISGGAGDVLRSDALGQDARRPASPAACVRSRSPRPTTLRTRTDARLPLQHGRSPRSPVDRRDGAATAGSCRPDRA